MVSRVCKKLAVARRSDTAKQPWHALDLEDTKSRRLQFLDAIDSALQSEAQNLEESGQKAPLSIYASLLRRCGNAKALAAGRRIHAHISQFHGEDPGPFLGNLLLQMYGKCGSLENARRTFDNVRPKTIFTWNLMLAAYAQNGFFDQALSLFHGMRSAAATAEEIPNAVTYSTVINACTMTGNLADGRAIHARIVDNRVEIDAVLGTSLINMYGKCCSVEDARRLFETLQTRCTVAWNTMLAIFVQNELYEQALELFHRMIEQRDLQPDSVSYTNAIRACTLLKNLPQGRAIHARSVSCTGVEWDVVLGNTLIKMYSVCGSIAEARRVFEFMASKNSVTWTTMSITYTQSGRLQEAMELYWAMNLEGVKPHQMVFPSFIGACCDLRQGRAIHDRVAAAGIGHDTAIGNSLLAMYGRFGELDQARRVFDQTPLKTVISWTSMIAANARNGDWEEALRLFRAMTLGAVKPNDVTCLTVLDACSDLGTLTEGRLIHSAIRRLGLHSVMAVSNTLVNMYGKCGSLAEARGVFDSMRERNLVTWTSILAAIAHQGNGKEALEIYRRMEVEGVNLDDVAFVSVISALGHAGLVGECRLCLVTMREGHGIEIRVEHYNCLIDSFGRAGWLEDAEELLRSMPFEPDYKEWITLLGCCKMHGDWLRGAEAAKVASELKPGVSQPFLMLLSTLLHNEDHEE